MQYINCLQDIVPRIRYEREGSGFLRAPLNALIFLQSLRIYCTLRGEDTVHTYRNLPAGDIFRMRLKLGASIKAAGIPSISCESVSFGCRRRPRFNIISKRLDTCLFRKDGLDIGYPLSDTAELEGCSGLGFHRFSDRIRKDLFL